MMKKGTMCWGIFLHFPREWVFPAMALCFWPSKHSEKKGLIKPPFLSDVFKVELLGHLGGSVP